VPLRPITRSLSFRAPHPYFAGWEQARRTRQRISTSSADYKVPTEWSSGQTELLESLAAQGFNAFGHLPGDAVGINSIISEFRATAFLRSQSPAALRIRRHGLLLFDDVYQAAYLGTKALIEAMGNKGAIVHLAACLSIRTPNSASRLSRRPFPNEWGRHVAGRPWATPTTRNRAIRRSNALLAGQKDKIGGIIATGLYLFRRCDAALRNLADKRIKLVGIDDDQDRSRRHRDGFVAGAIGQNPYGQAYIGTYALDFWQWLLCEGGCSWRQDSADYAFHRLRYGADLLEEHRQL